MNNVIAENEGFNRVLSAARFCLRHMLSCVIIGGCLWVAGCEGSSDDNDESNSDEIVPESGADSNSSHPMFPDGLHPNGAGAERIARVFANTIGTLDPSDTRPIVCIGDSITAGGYPAILESITGRKVVNAGVGGAHSEDGASRVAGLLSAHGPSHLCILFGINDINSGHPNSEIIGNLNAIASAAKAAGAEPIIGTLTPVFGKYADKQVYVNDLNARIRSMGVRVANLAGAF